LLATHVGLTTFAMLVFSGLLVATSVHSIYREAEADLLAAAQGLVIRLNDDGRHAQFTISDLYRHRFGMAPRDHAYVAVWDERGNRLYASPGLPDHALPGEKIPENRGPHPFHSRATGRYLDVIVATPQGGQLLIGRPLAKEWDALQWLILRILGWGALCLAGAVLAAFWISRRLSRPLTQLTYAAERISARHLSERIEPGDGSFEVVRLGRVFNQMLAGLQTAFQKQARFIADASHELRTPVAVVLSQAEHALHRERTPEEYRQALEVCLRSSRRMKGLIDDLLFLARADAGKLALRQVPMDLAAVAAQAVELLQPLADQHAIRLEPGLTPAPMVGDPDRLEQVVTNLITNAIRYNHPHGQVVVQTRLDGQAAILEVRDTGIGIPLADQPRLFDRFYRVDQARTGQDEAGTGLGLSLVQEIVVAHAGTIDLQSAPDAGTTITIRLPMKTDGLVVSPEASGSAE
jgi:heavy metal sensor kinase